MAIVSRTAKVPGPRGIYGRSSSLGSIFYLVDGFWVGTDQVDATGHRIVTFWDLESFKPQVEGIRVFSRRFMAREIGINGDWDPPLWRMDQKLPSAVARLLLKWLNDYDLEVSAQAENLFNSAGLTGNDLANLLRDRTFSSVRESRAVEPLAS